MFSATRSVARRFVAGAQRRNFSVKETRAKYYSNPTAGAENPTYLKEPGDKIFLGVGIGGLLLGVVLVFKGLFDMALGRNKLKN